MAGIGTVMFGKALVLAAWGGVTAAYASWKIRRARKGITLRYDPKRDVHYDPLEKWEGRGKRAHNVLIFTCGLIGICGIAFSLWSLISR